MNGTLSLRSGTLSYGDVGQTSNPAKKYVDWSITRSYQVQNPKAEPFTVAPGEVLTLFSGTRSTTVDSTTKFTVTLSPLATDRYRFSWTDGTNPTLRTDRALTLASRVLTLTANVNETLTIRSQAGDFTGVVVGDTIYIPGIGTGDPAGPFSELNVGYWTVLSISNTLDSVLLARLPGCSFSGVTETVTPTDDLDVVAYSASGVQVGDGVVLSSGFSSPLLKKFTVIAVTSTWFEVVSATPLPFNVAGLPTATGIHFYRSAKRYIRAEFDQSCTLRLNGDTGDSTKLEPWVAGDPDNTGSYEKVGPCWQAAIENTSQVPLSFLWITAE